MVVCDGCDGRGSVTLAGDAGVEAVWRRAQCTRLALLAPSTDRIPLATTKSLPSVLLQLCSSSRGPTEPLPRHGPPPHRISDNAPAVARETDLSCSRTRTDGGIRREWRPRPNAPSVQMM